jgi:hypothetical protein
MTNNKLPTEIIDYILSYCDGYMRFDLKKYKIKVKLKNDIVNISNNLELETSKTYDSNYEVENIFIKNKYTEHSVGYVNKTIKKNKEIIYNWIYICRIT